MAIDWGDPFFLKSPKNGRPQDILDNLKIVTIGDYKRGVRHRYPASGTKFKSLTAIEFSPEFRKKLYLRKYYLFNSARSKSRHKKYVRNMPKKVAEKCRKYHQKYYREHKEIMDARAIAWQRAHPKARAITSARTRKK